MFYFSRSLVLLGIFAVVVRGSDEYPVKDSDETMASIKADTIDNDTGNWTVGDCILAQFAMEITLRPNATNTNKTLVLELPPRAVADNAQTNCQNDTQILNLDWSDEATNTTERLARNFTVKFERLNNTAYGVSRVYGSFELAHFKQMYQNKTINVTSSVDIDFYPAPLVFKVPFGYSYLCSDVGEWQFKANLHYSFPDVPPRGTKLANATVSAKKVQLDAFRSKLAPPGVFQVPMDCDYQPNDIVPVAVGVTLAAMVVLVLCSYLFCRRRVRQRGYQSV